MNMLTPELWTALPAAALGAWLLASIWNTWRRAGRDARLAADRAERWTARLARAAAEDRERAQGGA